MYLHPQETSLTLKRCKNFRSCSLILTACNKPYSYCIQCVLYNYTFVMYEMLLTPSWIFIILHVHVINIVSFN